jgi:hypothetical protein
MPLIKHVDGVDIEMTQQEEADFLASLPPPVGEPVPWVISDRQFFQQAAKAGLISEPEALAAVQYGAMPAVITDFIESLPPASRFDALILISGATEFERRHPLTAAFGAAVGMDSGQIDDFFRAAGAL